MKANQSQLATTLVTTALPIALASMAAIACGSPWGLSRPNLIALVWVGLFCAIPVVLAAWSVLIDAHPMHRFAIPTVLMITFYGASKLGERWNHWSQANGSSIDCFVLFAVSCVCFWLAKRLLGWRMGPVYTGPTGVRLRHLFIWTAIAGYGFAVLGGVRPTIAEFTSPTLLPGLARMIGLRFYFGVGLVVSLGGFVTLGAVSHRTHRRHYSFVLAFISFVIVVAAVFLETTGWSLLGIALAMTFAIAILFAALCFSLFRSNGYGLDTNQDGVKPQTQSSNRQMTRLLMLASCVGLVGYSLTATITLADDRRDEAMRSKWRPFGIDPFNYDGDSIQGVSFRPNNTLTLEAVQRLAEHPINCLVVWDPPDAGALRALSMKPTMRIVQLRGSKISKAHLQELYDAKHLESVDLKSTTLLKPADIDALRAALPNCHIETR